MPTSSPASDRLIGIVVFTVVAFTIVAFTIVASLLAATGLAAPREDAAATEAWLKGPGKTAAPPELFGARSRLAQSYAQLGNRKKAEAVWLETTKLWAKGNFAKDGGAEASAAAEAWFHLLEPKFAAFMARTIQPPPKGPVEKQIVFLRRQFLALVETALGHPKKGVSIGEGDEAGGVAAERAGGLYDDYKLKVGDNGNTAWWFAAEVHRARLLERMADVVSQTAVPADLAPDERDQFRSVLDGYAAQMEAKAVKTLSLAWAAAQDRRGDNPWTVEVKRDLNRYKPDDVPLSRERRRAWQEPLPDATTVAAVEGVLRFEVVRACFDRRLASHPDEVLGSATVAITIAPDGSVSGVAADGLDDAFAACLRKRWLGVRGLPAESEARAFKIQFDFAAL
jgi:hypothetical protein